MKFIFAAIAASVLVLGALAGAKAGESDGTSCPPRPDLSQNRKICGDTEGLYIVYAPGVSRD